MRKRVEVFYSGRVQGVGFRFTAESIAGELGVCGWVKNLRDGNVQLMAEAEEGILKDFLSKIKESFSPYIADSDITWLEATSEFQGFEIRF